MKDKIISNNVNRKMAKCDITGEVIGAAAKYYYCVVSKVAVKMTNKLAECKRCKQKSYQHTVCSKCGGNEFIKMADMAIDERFVELTISEKGYNALKESAAAVKRSDWSSTS
jgi:ribosomal protein L32